MKKKLKRIYSKLKKCNNIRSGTPKDRWTCFRKDCANTLPLINIVARSSYINHVSFRGHRMTSWWRKRSLFVSANRRTFRHHILINHRPSTLPGYKLRIWQTGIVFQRARLRHPVGLHFYQLIVQAILIISIFSRIKVSYIRLI